ncbi:MAG: hypothetical protein KGL39_44175 [Patescibacteria group bacterium]|nr:hypothetical protein [Patescibacteria group bacterium]
MTPTMTPALAPTMTAHELRLLRWFGRADFHEQVVRRSQVEQTWWRMRQGLRRRRV